MISVERKY